MAALLAALLVAMVGITSAAFAQRSDDWELLGATRIGGYGFDLDEIEVGQSKGRFETIRIRARSNSVYIRDLRVVFGATTRPRRFAWGTFFGRESRPLRLILQAVSASSSASRSPHGPGGVVAQWSRSTPSLRRPGNASARATCVDMA
ncbi:MAG: hypothetical protein ACERIG_03985 [Hyphomicrobium sp.]